MSLYLPFPSPTLPPPTSGNDTIDGTDGNDVLRAYIGNDVLRAGSGNDLLVAMVGNHTLEGGAGNDSYFLSDSASTYLIDDIGGTDTVSFAPYELKGVYRVGSGGSADPAGNDLHLVFSGFTATIRNYFVTGDNGGHIETLRFSSLAASPLEDTIWQLDDILSALQQPWPSMENNFLYADPTGLDTLLDGGTGNDYLHSYFANDTLLGGSGNDTLVGGAGDNVFEGDAGDDTYQMQEVGGTDVLFDEAGDDTALVSYVVSRFERTGDDLIITSTHDSRLTIKNYFVDGPKGGLIEHLWLTGYAPDSSISGRYWSMEDILAKLESAADTVGSQDEPEMAGPCPPPPALKDEAEMVGPCPPPPADHGDRSVFLGTTRNDKLTGSAGNDSLNGGAGNDSLHGGDGNDLIIGGKGKDHLSGGKGEDSFVFAQKTDLGLGKFSDIIADFTSGSNVVDTLGADVIDLSRLDADTSTRKNDGFKVLLNRDAVFNKAGQLRYDSKTGILSGNTDKDAAAEFQILLKNKPAMLTLDAFIL